jgi:hypothetical protein
MSEKQEPRSLDRRAFFKKAGVGIGAAGAVAVGLGASAEAKVDSEGDKKTKAYRETEHVKRVYETARF